MAFGPIVGLALGAFLANGRNATAAGEVDLCAEAVSAAEDPGVFEELPQGDLIGSEDERDCAPAELLPDAACEDAPSTIWPAAVSACDAPLFKLRRGRERAPGLAMPSPGRRPLKGVAASDLGSFRASPGPSSPPPQKDMTFTEDLAIPSTVRPPRTIERRIAFEVGARVALPAGHARRLERPPEA